MAAGSGRRPCGNLTGDRAFRWRSAAKPSARPDRPRSARACRGRQLEHEAAGPRRPGSRRRRRSAQPPGEREAEPRSRRCVAARRRARRRTRRAQGRAPGRRRAPRGGRGRPPPRARSAPRRRRGGGRCRPARPRSAARSRAPLPPAESRGRVDRHPVVLAGDRGEVDGAGARVELAAGDRDQRVDRPVRARRLLDDRAQRRLALGVRVRPGRAERELGTPAHAGDRGAQLVGDLAREALLVAARGRDPREQAVERRRQPGDLVPRRPELEPAVEVVGAPVLRVAVIRATGRRAPSSAERIASPPASRTSAATTSDPSRTSPWRRSSGAIESPTTTVPTGRARRRPRSARRAAGCRRARRAPPPPPPAPSATASRSSAGDASAGRSTTRRRVEHPGEPVERLVVGRLADADARSGRTSSAAICGLGAGAQQRRRLARRAARQQHVAEHQQRPEPDGERRQRRGQQPRAERHRSR